MLFFVRHGESEANVKGVYAGKRDDCQLTEKGAEQAQEAGKDILKKKLNIDRIIASPLIRARNTANIIAETIRFNGADIQIEPRLCEYDMGSLTGTPLGKTSAELIAPEDAEDIHEFQHRVMSAIRQSEDLPGNTLIVAHAGVGKIIEATRLHHAPHIFHDLDGFPHGQVIELKFLEQL